MSAGDVVFSLDFELGWGHRESRPSYVERLRSQERSMSERIRELIDLFEEYDIPATWAVVGNLLEVGDDSLFHAPELFEYLVESEPNHDVGLHSHSHTPYDTLSPQEARADLSNAVQALEEWGCRPQSFVYPQNKIAHRDLLSEYGIICYRGPPEERFGALRQLLSPTTYDSLDDIAEPVNIPGSIFLAADRPSWYRRWYARKGLASAVDNSRMVHYWLHPHNVVTDDSLLSELEELFEKTRSAEDAELVRVRTMSEVATDTLD